MARSHGATTAAGHDTGAPAKATKIVDTTTAPATATITTINASITSRTTTTTTTAAANEQHTTNNNNSNNNNNNNNNTIDTNNIDNSWPEVL